MGTLKIHLTLIILEDLKVDKERRKKSPKERIPDVFHHQELKSNSQILTTEALVKTLNNLTTTMITQRTPPKLYLIKVLFPGESTHKTVAEEATQILMTVDLGDL
jgi:hypothetical protein